MAKIKGNKFDNTLNGSAGDDNILGKGGNDSLFGNDGNDKIQGGAGNDFLSGGNGDDILIGGAGDDRMDGGAGADQFNGALGNDTVDYATATTGVTAYLRANTSGGGATGDTYINVENVIGSAFNDNLQNALGGDAYGGAGNDTLYGGATLLSTDDGGRIRGDAGADILDMTYGNTEAWVQLGQGFDTIRGFIEGQDMLFIDLSDFGLGDTLDAFEIRNSLTPTAVGTNAQFIYESDAKNLWFDANGSAAGGLSLVAKFESSTINGNDLGVDDFAFQL